MNIKKYRKELVMKILEKVVSCKNEHNDVEQLINDIEILLIEFQIEITKIQHKETEKLLKADHEEFEKIFRRK